MTPQFRLTEPAIRDIEQIADYIARESGLEQADRFLSKLNAKCSKIAQFPNIGLQHNEIYLNYVVSQWISTSFSTYQQINILTVRRAMLGHRLKLPGTKPYPNS